MIRGFLIDNMLSARICLALKGTVYSCVHVRNLPDLGLTADDLRISRYANLNDLVLVTKDKGFLDTNRELVLPDRLVLLRLGNCIQAEATAVFLRHLEAILRQPAPFCIELTH